MITHFFSDPHWGHSNIIRYCNRPFEDVREMNRELIRRYNDTVGPQDTVLWCGDSFFKGSPDWCRGILAGLNGNKILVKGNHDRSHGAMAELGFALVLDECILHIAGRTCRVSHYPYGDLEGGRPVDAVRKDKFKALRPKRVKGEVLIHGHTHDKRKRQGNAIHVGVDAWDYRPATMAEVEALIELV
jgi:calcineurin-like phosphoesterase family protein